MNRHLTAFVVRNIPRRSLDLYFQEVRPDGKVGVPEYPLWHLYESAAEVPVDIRPLLSLTPETAQGLMDELWKSGVRPSEEGGVGVLAATQAHLNDMKQIAFAALKTQGVTP